VPAASSISQPTTPGRVTLPAQLSTYGRWAFFVAAAWFEINSSLNRAVFAGGLGGFGGADVQDDVLLNASVFE